MIDSTVNCDKCGQEVENKNDAVMLQMLMASTTLDETFALVMATPRHLLPVPGCAGSPSRAQYLEGQPRDARGYTYRPELETEIREAYARLMDEFGDEPESDN